MEVFLLGFSQFLLLILIYFLVRYFNLIYDFGFFMIFVEFFKDEVLKMLARKYRFGQFNSKLLLLFGQLDSENKIFYKNKIYVKNEQPLQYFKKILSKRSKNIQINHPLQTILHKTIDLNLEALILIIFR